ncbi:ester cyclase [Kitasatospora sp. A2-31]|uniref:ester cyclase n=1 Tax=Kitasatospora sp. A2-31 TaxID=2916414 RepID=UPI001EE8F0AB|nr:ester cyclase [Kitasatospora sp. A2-31]MCG6493345.1 ester cyclase [Kitasatospora sp. A2-31]
MTCKSSWTVRGPVAAAAAAAVLTGGSVAEAQPAAAGDAVPVVEAAVPAADAGAEAWTGGGLSAVAHFYGALSTGNTGLMARAVSQDWVDVPTHPGLGTGVAGAQQLVREIRAVFPDLVEAVTGITRSGDRIHVSLQHCGTHSAEFAGVPATYKYVCFRGEETQTVTNGLISTTEHWEDIDGFLKEVGK